MEENTASAAARADPRPTRHSPGAPAVKKLKKTTRRAQAE